MKRSDLVSGVAKKFPRVSRQLLTLSIRGFLPSIHEHWLFHSLAGDLFEGIGFPMWRGSARLYVPRDLRPIYLDYMDVLSHEPLTRRVFKGLLKSGSVVIDVGANIGFYTLLAASKVGPSGHVHAVECSPKSLSLLAENIRKNRLQNVEIHPFAASSSRGTLTLKVSPVGLSSFPPNSRWFVTPDIGATVEVPAVPLDDVIHTRVDVVKIDAEGADLDVLKGMKRILSENEHLSVIVEWAPPMLADIGKDPLELPQWLEGAGFGTITVLDQYNKKKWSLNEAVEMVRGGKLPKAWVADLVAARTQSPGAEVMMSDSISDWTAKPHW